MLSIFKLILSLEKVISNVRRCISHICVKDWTEDKEGHILITPNFMSLEEIENYIDYLKEELEDIRKKAKRLYGK